MHWIEPAPTSTEEEELRQQGDVTPVLGVRVSFLVSDTLRRQNWYMKNEGWQRLKDEDENENSTENDPEAGNNVPDIIASSLEQPIIFDSRSRSSSEDKASSQCNRRVKLMWLGSCCLLIGSAATMAGLCVGGVFCSFNRNNIEDVVIAEPYLPEHQASGTRQPASAPTSRPSSNRLALQHQESNQTQPLQTTTISPTKEPSARPSKLPQTFQPSIPPSSLLSQPGSVPTIQPLSSLIQPTSIQDLVVIDLDISGAITETLEPSASPSVVNSDISASTLSLGTSGASILLPQSTINVVLNDAMSPQSKAFTWMMNNVDSSLLLEMEYWRKQQLFALAAIYFALGGENWKVEEQQNWMNGSLSECAWTTTYPCTPNCTLRYYAIYCSEDERVNALEFAKMSQNLTGTFPRELAFLSSLQILKVVDSGYRGEMEDVLPWNFIGDLSNMTHLALSNNQLHGTIPTAIGLLTGLTTLMLHSNALTGAVPSEIGLLSHVSSLYLENNPSLSGVIPQSICELSLSYLGIDCDTGDIACPELCRCPSQCALTVEGDIVVQYVPEATSNTTN
jgi:hypothetical protein